MSRASSELRQPSIGGRRFQRRLLSGVLLVPAVLFVVVMVGYARITGPRASGPVLFLLFVALGAAAARPIIGLFTIVFVTMVGDSVTAPWFPFAKNLSSGESLLFVSNNLVLSPLEILTATTFLFWIVDRVGTPRARLVRGPMTYAIAGFTAMVIVGFLTGISGGGDLRIALFEGRALFILLPVYLLASNLCGPAQLRRLAWTVIVAVVLNSLLALKFLSDLTALEADQLEDLGEHTASIHFNVLFLLTAVLFLYRGASRGARFTMLATCVPVGMVYFAAQRRSAIVALGAGAILVLLSLWWRDRARFWAVGPLLAIVTIGYTGAFWNSTSSSGFPAQAIKSVVASDQVSEKDRSSDLYRQIENFDINYTIRQSPVTGLGFGQKFLQPVQLPDISFFEFHEYIPHNSILWIWIKTGFFGFASMLMMFAIGIREGVRSLMAERDRTSASIIMVGIAYVVMFAVVAFVDIAWDPRSLMFLAVSFALCTFDRSRAAGPPGHRRLMKDAGSGAGTAVETPTMQSAGVS